VFEAAILVNRKINVYDKIMIGNKKKRKNMEIK